MVDHEPFLYVVFVLIILLPLLLANLALVEFLAHYDFENAILCTSYPERVPAMFVLQNNSYTINETTNNPLKTKVYCVLKR